MVRHRAKLVGLLRGTNVGGENLLAKDDLCRCLEGIEFSDVV